MAKYKQMLLAGSFASALLLGACGNDGEKKDDTKTEDAAKEESTEESTEDSTEEDTTEESTEDSTEEDTTEE
ncbi:hypothetical protein [Macrococcus armenti]|nr:hypothetical protein [Macrococcus armenti]UBH08079.1 hypothetical protein LAU41_08615 [Macrococcus armenti]